MTPTAFRDARYVLGHQWGLDRPLSLSEFGRVLRFSGHRPGDTVRDYERGKSPVSGPMSLAIELMLAGARPDNLDDALSGTPNDSHDEGWITRRGAGRRS